MKKIVIILILTISYTSIVVGQSSNIFKSNEANSVDFIDFEIKMVINSYTCSSHQSVTGYEKDKCTICGKDLVRDKKLKIYALNKSIDLTKIKGRVIVVFNDGTQISRKLQFNKDFGWIKLGDNAYNTYNNANLKLKYNNKQYQAIFGEPIIHSGHHH